MLQIIHQFEKFILGGLQAGGGFFLDAQKVERNFFETAVYIIIVHTFYFYFSVYPLKFFRIYVRRKMNGGYLYGDQISIGIVVLVEICNERLISTILKDSSIELVSDPIEKE